MTAQDALGRVIAEAAVSVVMPGEVMSSERPHVLHAWHLFHCYRSMHPGMIGYRATHGEN